MWLKFELLYNLRCVITLPASIKRIGSNRTEKGDTISPLKVYGDICLAIQGQITLWSDLAKIRTHPRYNMHVLVTYKSKMDRIDSNREKVETLIFQMLKGSPLRSQYLDLNQIRTDPSFYVCPHYLQVL